MSETLALFGGEPTLKGAPEFRWPPIQDEDVARVVRLMRKQELSYYGREGEVRELEDSFCQYLGLRYGLAMSSGTAALHSAFFGLGLGPGDEVLAPTFTFLSTVMPIFVVNATPVLVDAEPDTGNMDPEDLERKITSRAKAIVVTHLCGHACNMSEIMRIAAKYKLRVIEDCSHAHGGQYRERWLGTLGDVSIFSLQASKIVAAGQGGLLLTNDQEIYERATLLGHFRVRSFDEVQSPRYREFAGTGYGLNYRMHPLAAALANSQFQRLDQYIATRNENLMYLSEGLRGIPGIQPPVVKPYVTRHAWFSYKPLYCAEQLGGLRIQTYVQALQAEGIPISRSQSRPLHQEPLFQVGDDLSGTYGWEVPGWTAPRRRYTQGELPLSEYYASRALSIPTYTEPLREKFADGQSLQDIFDGVARACEKLAAHVDRLLAHELSAQPVVV